MNSEPSFYSLYRKSRYHPDELPDAGGPRQRRRELFAVAGPVAFTLKHDEAFRRHFLREVCRLEWPGNPPPQIELQPNEHFDLVIKLPSAFALCVIEFKIDAALENIQNPLEECFMQPGGYGQLIDDDQDYKAFRSKAYIVLADFAKFDEEKKRGSLTCRRCTWGNLDPGGASGGSLWNDLLNSLARIFHSPPDFSRFGGFFGEKSGRAARSCPSGN